MRGMVGQVFTGTWWGVVHAVDGTQPMFFTVCAELSAGGIKHPIAKAYQASHRFAHLRHHQLERVQNAVNTRRRERRTDLLKQRGNLPAELPMRQHLPGTLRIAAQFLTDQRHRQGVAIMF
ncbi:hypothetical protein D3C79_711030 [compost metagenome]